MYLGIRRHTSELKPICTFFQFSFHSLVKLCLCYCVGNSISCFFSRCFSEQMSSILKLSSLRLRSNNIHSPEINTKHAKKHALSVQSCAVECSLHLVCIQVGAVFIACRYSTLSVAMATGEIICQQNMLKLSPLCHFKWQRVRRQHTVFISKHHVTRNGSVDRGDLRICQHFHVC